MKSLFVLLMLIPSLFFFFFSKQKINKRHKIHNTHKTLKTAFTFIPLQNRVNYYSIELAKLLYTSGHLTSH